MKLDHVILGNKEYPYTVIKVFAGTYRQQYLNVVSHKLHNIIEASEKDAAICDAATKIANYIDVYIDEGFLTNMTHNAISRMLEDKIQCLTRATKLTLLAPNTTVEGN